MEKAVKAENAEVDELKKKEEEEKKKEEERKKKEEEEKKKEEEEASQYFFSPVWMNDHKCEPQHENVGVNFLSL